MMGVGETPCTSIVESMKKPRSWDEARKHPGISSIEYEAPGSPMSNDDAPWLVTLSEGWSLNEDMTIVYVCNLRDLQGLWGDIVNLPSTSC